YSSQGNAGECGAMFQEPSPTASLGLHQLPPSQRPRGTNRLGGPRPCQSVEEGACANRATGRLRADTVTRRSPCCPNGGGAIANTLDASRQNGVFGKHRALRIPVMAAGVQRIGDCASAV